MRRRQKRLDDAAPNPPAVEISKSRRKRDALAVRALAEELVALDEARLGRVPLDDPIRDAVRQTRRIRSHIARKRQLQYVARLLRAGDTEPIAEAIASFRNEARRFTARHHRAEAWRDRLLSRGDEALAELIAACPALDAPAVRRCMREAQRESREGRPPSAARTLFRLLRDLDPEQPLPPCPAER